jgi:hypothetical protein
MSDDHFQLVFAGRLADGVSPAQARQSLQSRFKLSDGQLERLFEGTAVTVKRNLTESAAERYRQAFLEAGAIVEIEPLTGPSERQARPASGGEPAPDEAAPQSPAGPRDERRPSGGEPRALGETAATLQVLPAGAPVGEQLSDDEPVRPDISHLSLAPAEGMSLADCAPSAPDTPDLDLERYELLPIDPDDGGSTEPGEGR